MEKQANGQLYEVEIKSASLLKEGKRSLITYFKGGKKKKIVQNVQFLYPQYTQTDDKPIVNIRPISQKEYDSRINSTMILQKQHLIQGAEHIFNAEDLNHENLGN